MISINLQEPGAHHMRSIPKLVHTCWFGGNPKPEIVARCLASQANLLSGYEFHEWTEQTFDLDSYPFLRAAYDQRKYAHVSDMVRLLVLKEHGGIYLDTDVEILRSFDSLLDCEFLGGYIWRCMLGTAVLGAAPNHPIVDALLKHYLEDETDFGFESANNHFFTRYFIDHVEGFRLDGREWRSGGIHILDMYGFEQPRIFGPNGYALHHFTASWRGQSAMKRYLKAAIIKAFGLAVYRLFINEKSFRNSVFRTDYLRAVSQGGRR